MSLYYADDLCALHVGDCLEVMAAMDAESVSAIVTDPPYGLSFMGREWDHGIPGEAFWTEALRVAKPGAHLVAFGGTRTFHRLACAIEDAGWEIRDCLGWLYGSGFPKSLDVSKAIDKVAGAKRERVAGGCGSVGSIATVGLRPGQAISNEPLTDAAREWQGWGTALKPAWEPIILARKPLASPAIDVMQAVTVYLEESGLDGEPSWRYAPARPAARKSPQPRCIPTSPPSAVATSAASASAPEMRDSGSETARGSESKPEPTERETGNESTPQTAIATELRGKRSSTTTAASAPAVENPDTSSCASTTSTEADPHTARAVSGRRWPVISGVPVSLTAIASSVGTATPPSGSTVVARITVRLPESEHIIEQTADGCFTWPNGLPRTIPSRPLTVAANVQRYGTGALNVDGCRVDGAKPDTTRGAGGQHGRYGPIKAQGRVIDDGRGRWPANICHDGSDEVLAVFPETSSNSAVIERTADIGYHGNGEGVGRREFPGDSGSAARFFYCAKATTAERNDGLHDFEAKAPGAGSRNVTGNPLVDRIHGLNPKKNTHPTVKPVALMRWLVRLVTPPGGIALDPFMGSGTTLLAARAEGFRSIGIDREAEYVEVARRRMSQGILDLGSAS